MGAGRRLRVGRRRGRHRVRGAVHRIKACVELRANPLVVLQILHIPLWLSE